jgi:hypothetical protein
VSRIFLCRFFNNGDRRNKPVASPRNRLNETRVVGIIIDCATEPLEDYIQTPIKIDVRSFRPEPLAQFLATHNIPWPLKKQQKKAERLFLDFDSRAVPVQRAIGSIRFEHAEAQSNSRRIRAPLTRPHESGSIIASP